jgi:membrane protein implicated in regulation of membrane protease activity
MVNPNSPPIISPLTVNLLAPTGILVLRAGVFMTVALTEIYTIATAIGSIYLTFSVLMGQLHGGDGAHGHHGGPGGHSDCGHEGHHIDGGADATHAIDSSHSDATHAVDSAHSETHSAIARSQRPMVLGKHAIHDFLSLLSPMTISIFSAFFGLTGLCAGKLFPMLGAFTLIPAILMGIVVTSLLMTAFTWAFLKSSVSTNARIDDLIGQIAEVCVPIKEGRTGEITCVMNSKRYNYPATGSGNSFSSGTRVMISDFENGVVKVEKFEDYTLDIQDAVIKRAEL